MSPDATWLFVPPRSPVLAESDYSCCRHILHGLLWVLHCGFDLLKNAGIPSLCQRFEGGYADDPTPVRNSFQQSAAGLRVRILGEDSRRRSAGARGIVLRQPLPGGQTKAPERYKSTQTRLHTKPCELLRIVQHFAFVIQKALPHLALTGQNRIVNLILAVVLKYQQRVRRNPGLSPDTW